MHHVSVELLEQAFLELKRNASAGIDGVSWQGYDANLLENLASLHVRVQRGTYKALPVRRRFVPKPDGKRRPLGVTALEDKIVQRAIVMVLNTIYESEFLGISYGFRPGRNQHDALDALSVGITSTAVNWVLDADIRSFFDRIDQQWLIRFLRHRIGDERIIRLIQKWLKAGVMDEDEWSVSNLGTPQGAVISPLLANIYLHYVFDLWAVQWRQREADGNIIMVRYADDIIVGFRYEEDAKRFQDALRVRLERFGLDLHPDKTRLLEFGRLAAARRKRQGLGKPQTFKFLGFVFICGRTRWGAFQLQRKSRSDRMRETLRRIKERLRRHKHAPIADQGRWLRAVVTGWLNYHAVPTNSQALAAFRYHVVNLWLRTLRRRSQKDATSWARMTRIAEQWLPRARILHPWPDQRFAVKHPRQEPSA